MSVIENNHSFLDEVIQRAITQRISEETVKLVTEAKKKLDERTGEIVAGVLVDVMKMANFQTFEDRIVFTIKKGNV